MHTANKMKARTLSPMKTRHIGISDLYITPMGFGSWTIGDSGWQLVWGLTVAWTLRHPAVTAAIVGERKPERVDEVVAAEGIRSAQADLKEIETVARLAAYQLNPKGQMNIGFICLGNKAFSAIYDYLTQSQEGRPA